jgi:SNF2 family DNA or RNA helicase
MNRSVAVLQGTRQKRRDLYNSTATYLVINHDGLSTISDLVAADKHIGLVIVDECAAFRNGTTDRYKILKSCLRPDMRLWMMSGSPCPNAPTDAWAQARLVRPENVPPYFTVFKRATMDQVNMYKWVPRHDSDHLVHKALQPAIRYAKKDCVDLPDITYQDRECDLTPQQIKLFKEMRRDFQTTHEGGVITAANAAVKMVKLLQICCGVVYDNDRIPRVSIAASRLEALEEIISECSQKVIVWVPFKSVLYHLVEQINTRFYKGAAAGVSGETTDNQRTEIFTAFQEHRNPMKVLIAHPGTAAHGLNLTTASVSIWYAPFFSAEQYMQANERINRPGQKNEMSVIHLGATALEWGVYDLIKTKNNRQNKILELYNTEVLDT